MQSSHALYLSTHSDGTAAAICTQSFSAVVSDVADPVLVSMNVHFDVS